jgi:hypothetical protein
MSGSERTVAALVVLGLMVVVAEGWVGNFRDWVRATVGATPSTSVSPGAANAAVQTANQNTQPGVTGTVGTQRTTSSGPGFNTF